MSRLPMLYSALVFFSVMAFLSFLGSCVNSTTSHAHLIDNTHYGTYHFIRGVDSCNNGYGQVRPPVFEASYNFKSNNRVSYVGKFNGGGYGDCTIGTGSEFRLDTIYRVSNDSVFLGAKDVEAYVGFFTVNTFFDDTDTKLLRVYVKRNKK